MADVEAQLQSDIEAAKAEVNQAKSALEKAKAKESDKATDMFANDNALNKPGQLFDNSDMPEAETAKMIEEFIKRVEK